MKKKIKIMLLDNWGDSSQSMMERYRFQTPGNNYLRDTLESSTRQSESDTFIIKVR